MKDSAVSLSLLIKLCIECIIAFSVFFLLEFESFERLETVLVLVFEVNLGTLLVALSCLEEIAACGLKVPKFTSSAL